MTFNKKNAQDFAVLTTGKVVQVFLGFATLRVVTEVLSEAEVGVYYTLLTLINLLAFVFFNPLGQFYGRNLVHWQQQNNIHNATAVMIGLRLLAMPVALVIAVACYYLFDYSQYFSISSFSLFMLIALFALTHGVLLNATNVLVGRLTFILFAAGTLILGFLASLLMIQLEKTAVNWLYGLFTVQILISYFLYHKLTDGQSLSIDRIKRSVNKKYVNKVFFFVLPVSITLFLQWGQTASFRLLIEDLYSAQVLAAIAVGMAISAAVFSALESLAQQFYMPIYLRKITNKTAEQRVSAWNELAGVMLPVYAAVTVYVIAFAPTLASILVADKFYESYLYAMIGASIELFRVTTNLIYMVSQSEIKTKTTMMPYLTGFIVMTIGLLAIDIEGSLWLVPVILAVSYFIVLSLMYVNMRRLLPIRIDLSLCIKSALMVSPLLAAFFYSAESSVLSALSFLAVGGIYLLCSSYLILKKNITRMAS